MLKKSISFCGVSAHKFVLEVIDINIAAKLLQGRSYVFLCYFFILVVFDIYSGIQWGELKWSRK